MSNLYLADNVLSADVAQEPIRAGFGRGLAAAAARDERIVGACADLTDSTHMGEFAKAFPERFVEIGIAEQNLVTVGSGLASSGEDPICQ